MAISNSADTRFGYDQRRIIAPCSSLHVVIHGRQSHFLLQYIRLIHHGTTQPPEMSTATGGSARPHRVAVQQYKSHEVNRALLAQRCEEQLGKKPFDWQLDACVSVLCGEDVILDVGTGNGKTLVFSLPLLMDPKDINIIVSPLSALMIDQVNLLLF